MNLNSIVRNILFRTTLARSKSRHLFIVGAPRSGTTLIKSIIAAHSKFTSIKWESTGILGYKNIDDYEQFVFETVNAHTVKILFEKNANVVSFYDEYVRKHNKERNVSNAQFVDKVWPGLFRLVLARYWFPRSRFVYIYRDPRDCYCSARSHPNIPQGRSPSAYAAYWKRCVTSMIRAQDNENVLTVRYEDYVLDPVVQLDRIMLFLGEKQEPEQLNPSDSTRSVLSREHHHANLKKPVSGESVGRWRKKLNNREIEIIEKTAGQMMEKIGYQKEVLKKS